MGPAVPKSIVVIDPPHREWTRRQACIICEPGKQSTPTECAHVKNKRNHGDENNLIPLCQSCHREQHRIGIKTFAARHKKDLGHLARSYRKWADQEMEFP